MQSRADHMIALRPRHRERLAAVGGLRADIGGGGPRGVRDPYGVLGSTQWSSAEESAASQGGEAANLVAAPTAVTHEARLAHPRDVCPECRYAL